MAARHQIKRLEVALRVPDQQQAQDLQQELSTFCRTELPELLQEAFDCAAPDRYIRINHLELNLAPFQDAEEFRNKLDERIRDALRQQLDDAQNVTAAVARASSQSDSDGPKGPELPVFFDVSYQAADVFIHILKHGITPWYAMSAKFDDVINEVIELLYSKQSFRIQLATFFLASKQRLRRFILQTPAPKRRTILALLTGIDESLIVDIFRLLDTFMDGLTRRAGAVVNHHLLIREITCRHMIQKQAINYNVLRLVLEEVIAELINSPGIKADRILADLPLAGMEIKAVFPRQWQTAIRDSIFSFAISRDDQRERATDISDKEMSAGKTVLPEQSDEIPKAMEEKRSADFVPDESTVPASRPNDAPAQRVAVQENVYDTDTPDQSPVPATEKIPPVKADYSTPGEGAKVAAKKSADKTVLSAQSDETSEAVEEKRSGGFIPDENTVPTNQVSDAPARRVAIKDAERQTTYDKQAKQSGQGNKPAEQPQEFPHSDQVFPRKDGLGPTSPSCDSMKTSHNPDSLDTRDDLPEGLPWMTSHQGEEYHINNAGLVLLAPFFSVVFKDLGYVGKGRGFVNKQACMRAVHFSQFLVTAEHYPPECGMTLNKILCGMEVNEPMERFIDLTAKELDAAQEVIDSALKHWTVLKRTSAPVFRQTFLQHEGILTSQSSNWLLRIERTSVDVLIDMLPWTISIIKHPWMKQPVMVEW